MGEVGAADEDADPVEAGNGAAHEGRDGPVARDTDGGDAGVVVDRPDPSGGSPEGSHVVRVERNTGLVGGESKGNRSVDVRVVVGDHRDRAPQARSYCPVPPCERDRRSQGGRAPDAGCCKGVADVSDELGEHSVGIEPDKPSRVVAGDDP